MQSEPDKEAGRTKPDPKTATAYFAAGESRRPGPSFVLFDFITFYSITS